MSSEALVDDIHRQLTSELECEYPSDHLLELISSFSKKYQNIDNWKDVDNFPESQKLEVAAGYANILAHILDRPHNTAPNQQEDVGSRVNMIPLVEQLIIGLRCISRWDAVSRNDSQQQTMDLVLQILRKFPSHASIFAECCFYLANMALTNAVAVSLCEQGLLQEISAMLGNFPDDAYAARSVIAVTRHSGRGIATHPDLFLDMAKLAMKAMQQFPQDAALVRDGWMLLSQLSAHDVTVTSLITLEASGATIFSLFDLLVPLHQTPRILYQILCTHYNISLESDLHYLTELIPRIPQILQIGWTFKHHYKMRDVCVSILPSLLDFGRPEYLQIFQNWIEPPHSLFELLVQCLWLNLRVAYHTDLEHLCAGFLPPFESTVESNPPTPDELYNFNKDCVRLLLFEDFKSGTLASMCASYRVDALMVHLANLYPIIKASALHQSAVRIFEVVSTMWRDLPPPSLSASCWVCSLDEDMRQRGVERSSATTHVAISSLSCRCLGEVLQFGVNYAVDPCPPTKDWIVGDHHWESDEEDSIVATSFVHSKVLPDLVSWGLAFGDSTQHRYQNILRYGVDDPSDPVHETTVEQYDQIRLAAFTTVRDFLVDAFTELPVDVANLISAHCFFFQSDKRHNNSVN
eukprot:TRINITY_DN3165_c0_g3_i3.p1 TRINITY_DN3165_c0_g3~~TRINITY_DN3165_c0_g3_i3.p1  ORF type:complete len:635 (+),score=71.03 TRINITY_DN3165_c0_g3_i3:139-2043(+)